VSQTDGIELLDMIVTKILKSGHAIILRNALPFAVETIFAHVPDEYLFDITTVHPLFLYLSLSGTQSYFLHHFRENLECFFLAWTHMDMKMTITKNISQTNSSQCWKKVKMLLDIPDVVTFDVLGYFLYSLSLEAITARNDEARAAFCFLMDTGFVPSEASGVVHPIHALLYNVLQNFESVEWIELCSEENWSSLLHRCFLELKGNKLYA
jgi:hypothetical protein